MCPFPPVALFPDHRSDLAKSLACCVFQKHSLVFFFKGVLAHLLINHILCVSAYTFMLLVGAWLSLTKVGDKYLYYFFRVFFPGLDAFVRAFLFTHHDFDITILILFLLVSSRS
ncbi:hypothetical protein ASPWEDRAFT_321819 [Aspergillus wentii DTO 134E9]|uniref:Uncharacterized protein n=1 Tax=Aspergillus wentii DTO 134E9 TaxID=1073089 RepID=A0A1L9RTZ4_ASPWE|nr:uncharacterized protein ASPWEDRAFT_321819 [Aspergillus wentii DTO 134E9]OJJ38400.1 hypothetical protein ASPWEDRAFT_321819 [Aspergillus wentii DTO 134E9]